MDWMVSQPEPDTEEEDEFSIGLSISLNKFKGAERHLYNLLLKLLVINFNNLDFL
jgi:hypothetical protein